MHVLGDGDHDDADEEEARDDPGLAATELGHKERVDNGRPEEANRVWPESERERALIAVGHFARAQYQRHAECQPERYS